MTHRYPRRVLLATGTTALCLTVLLGCSGTDDEPVVPSPGDPAPASSPPATSTPASPAPASSAPDPGASTGSSPGASASASPSDSSGDSGGDTGTDVGSALLDAGQTAEEAVADGVVVGIDPERRGTVWEVEVVTEDGGQQQVVLSEDGSEVVSGPTDDRPDAEDRAENQQLREAAVDYREAVQVAQDEVGGTVTQLGLDSDDGRLTWEVDVDGPDGRRDLVLDAADGTVLQNERDD